MHLPLSVSIEALRAVGEETRLRIVALLRHGELTVSDLTQILGQSQPRISRHLKLLTDAGVVDKHREGTFSFFDLVHEGPLAELVTGVLAATDDNDAVLAADLDRLDVVRARRAAAAQEYFAGVAERWDEERLLHAPDEIVEAAILETIGNRPYRRVLDLGTGTGRMLQLLVEGRDDIVRAIGIDNSHSMLAVARANMERAELRNVDFRQGDVYRVPIDGETFDLIVIHQVLHFLDDPARAISEASRLLAQNGRLLVVDFAPHGLEFLRAEHAHRRLGFRPETVTGWMRQCGLTPSAPRQIAAPRTDDQADDERDDERLTVTLWLGRERLAVHEPIDADRDDLESSR